MEIWVVHKSIRDNSLGSHGTNAVPDNQFQGMRKHGLVSSGEHTQFITNEACKPGLTSMRRKYSESVKS
ncbi:Uncharacterized protein HZ326_4332 [Fusarium oxysporum f. sp. albedinis]|nr:Uncharacterized protein HZ326_4332 [Fusarium oxysporum f. sp. albedinis]